MKRKIAVIYFSQNEVGGAESRPLYIAEALKEKYSITLISNSELDFIRLNMQYGTNLSPDDVNVIVYTNPSYGKILNKAAALQGALFTRFCKKISNRFDLTLSTWNLVDLKQRGIQFIKDMSFDDDLWRKYTLKKLSFYQRKSLIRSIYLLLARLLSGTSKQIFKKHILVSNSKWTADVLKNQLGVDSTIIYPPVVGSFPTQDWDKRINDFVYLGRLAQEKKIEYIIELISNLREMGLKINLHLVGPLTDSKYSDFLKNIFEKNKTWIIYHGAKYDDEKKFFLSSYRYGINAFKYEPFGISVAEMVKAGMIVWVPSNGGQAEIVNHSLLTYDDKFDALEKINFAYTNEEIQKNLLNHLSIQAEKFSTERFMLEIQKIVEEALKTNDLN